MIKRVYFYHCTLMAKQEQFCNGIITTSGFFPSPEIAYADMRKNLEEMWNVDGSKIRCETFHKI